MGGNSEAATVLVVDDDDSLRLLCRVNLELEGYRVLEAATIEAAQALLVSEPVRVVLLDVRVGAGDGRTLLRELRATRPEVAVAFLTGTADLEELQKTEADGLLRKPFSITELTDTVRALVTA